MKALKARGDSNAAKKTDANGVKDPDGGGIEKLGYSVEPFPSTGPAVANSDLSITKGFSGFNQQPGSSLSSYKHQPKEVDAGTGK